MRLLVLGIALCACGTEYSGTAQTYAFGPFTIPASSEVTTDCVQITLHNDQPLNINQVELTTGIGFHHSNWFFVPEHEFAGDDGTFTCTDRNFDQAVAAIFGGVLFAQSTQATHETQAFPPGAIVYIPAHSKLVAQIHLLNSTDDTINLAPSIGLTPIPDAEVTTVLAGVSFENQSIALPPHAESAFTVDCDIATTHQQVFGRPPDFNLYYGLAHYHAMGTGLTIEAVKDDGTATTAFTTSARVGDTLGGPIDPLFSMVGYSRLRFTCDYTNSTDQTVPWGNGSDEMCVFLAFSDSPDFWAGGVTAVDAPGDPTVVNSVMTYQHACSVFASDASR